LGGGQILICTFLSFSYFSCNKDTISDLNSKNESPEDRIERRVNEKLSKSLPLTTETLNLEQINEFLRSHGLRELTQKELKSEISSRTTYPCTTWVAHGDWNGNYVFSAQDLYLANVFLCSQPGGCNGNYIISNSSPGSAIDFAYLSYFANGTEELILNQNDIDAGKKRILGIIPCY
jgi:hypothetical protein